MIIERHVQEGQAIRAGEVMFVLSSERIRVDNSGAQQAISDLLRR
ncbi:MULTISPECIES: hypothetical protein [unclassified Undibacterium]|nr:MULTISPECIES: hypothetical protein [unclassified Undibacterium]